MNCNYKVKITDIQTKYKFKVFCTGYDDSELKQKIDTMYEAWPKASGEGETLTLDNTANATMSLDLKGNTSQVTTTGKNLANVQAGTYTISNFYYIDTATNLEITSDMVGKAYSFSYNISLSDVTTTSTLISGVIGRSSNTTSMQTQIKTATFEPTETDHYVKIENVVVQEAWVGQYFVVRFAGFGSSSTATCTYSNVQIEQSTTATDYEPYTNGASPNPDYPQDVEVVTGDNTIIIANSDNTESQSFNVNLGTMELCKIGTYQDYIYKENKKWYKYGAIGKVVLNGSESWSYASGDQRFGLSNVLDSLYVSGQRLPIYSNYFNYYTLGNRDGIGFLYYYTGGNRTLFLYNYAYTVADDFKEWLSTHNTIIYYQLNTPTTTEITDTTLISQLEALAGAESYSGQTNISQTNDDKPFIITAKALKDLSNL